tara:strand:- start:516 stop:794 length:279 start_codon:yes stop_codon:yes gene_type:complete
MMSNLYLTINDFSYFGKVEHEVNNSLDKILEDGNTLHLNLSKSTSLAETLWTLQERFQQHNQKYEYRFYVKGYNNREAQPVVVIYLKEEVKE